MVLRARLIENDTVEPALVGRWCAARLVPLWQSCARVARADAARGGATQLLNMCVKMKSEQDYVSFIAHLWQIPRALRHGISAYLLADRKCRNGLSALLAVAVRDFPTH